MSNRQEYIEAVETLVQGDLPLGEPEIILAISMAVKEHSRHRPRVVVEDEDGDGGFDYALSLLSYWADGFSAIKRVEYPVDDDDETPDILQDDRWTIYETPSGKFLRFLENTPSASEDMRVTYTALHTCTDSACTVEGFDEEAVQALAAANFCGMLATYYAQSQDSTIDADSVNHSSKTRDYEARRKTLRKMYFDHIGIQEGKAPAASVTRDQDKKPSWQGTRLTHPSRYR